MDPHQQRMAWRRHYRWLWYIVLLFLAMGVVGVLVSWPVTGRPPAVREVLMVVLPLPAIGVAIVGVVWLLGRRGVRWAQPSPLLALDPGERRQLVRAIRRNEPIPDEHRETAKALVRDTDRSDRISMFSMVLLCANGTLMAVDAPTSGFRSVGVGLVVLAVVVFGLGVWRSRRVRRTARTLQAPENGDAHDT